MNSVQSSSRSLSSNKQSAMDVSGIFPPIATPFDADGNLALNKLEHNISMWNKVPLRGLAVLGSNGEVVYMKPEEKVEMIRHARKILDPEKLVIGGAGCESTRDTIDMCIKMSEAGADVLMVVTPCYYKGRMTNESFVQHYTRVADESPAPILLYSVPGNTGIDLSPEVVVKLASHPNIIGMKDSGGDIVKIGSIVHKTQHQDFQVLAGSAGFLLPALVAGCVGGVCASANMLGDALCNLHSLYQQGKLKEAKELQQRIIAPNAAVTKMFGIPALKASMEWFGYYGGPTRLPLVPLKSEEVAKVREAFVNSGFLN